jgi:MFS family permease
LPGAFRRFLAARLLGVFCRHLISIAIAWEVYDRTNSAFALGLIGLVQVAPVVGLALVTGPLIDRTDRRRTASLALVGTASMAVLFAVASWQHWPVWILYAGTFGLGVSSAFSQPSMSSLIPAIVEARVLARANAWSSTIFETTSMIGPAAGGALIGVTGVTWPCYAGGAAMAVAASLTILGVRTRPGYTRPATAPARPSGEWREGVRFVRRTPLLLSAITLDLFAVLFAGATALLPIFARDILGVGATGLGGLRAAPAIGASAMALASTRMSPWRHPGRVLLTAVALFGVVMVAFGLSRSLALSLALLAAAGALDNISVVIRATLEQVVTPDALRGRVSAVNYVFIGLSNELGAFESGVAAALLGPVPAVVLGGGVTLCVVWVIARAWPQLARLGPLHELQSPT